MGVGDGASLKVDPDLLSRYGDMLQAAAMALPDAPAPFVVSGTDPVSLAIAGRLAGVEGGIQEALPQVRADATATASNVVSAAGMYQRTDEQLAAQYEKHQFDQAGTAASGAGGSDSMSQLSQMMSMPMQIASQVAQLPMTAMGAVASAPQAVMQGVQQIGQMTGGLDKADGSAAAGPGSELPEDRRGEDRVQPDDDHEKQERQQGAAPGASSAESAPDAGAREPSTTTAVPQQSSPRHAAPDPELNL